MRLLILSFFISLTSFAEEGLDRKQGFLFGLGMTASQHKFPVQFQGVSKNKIDEDMMVYGPTLHLGYDLLFFRRFVLGLRLEGYTGDTMGTGTNESDSINEKTTGKARAVNLSLRSGVVYQFTAKNPVEEYFDLFAELFLEGGLTSGLRTFKKNYAINDGTINEIYSENVDVDYTARVLGAGINVSTLRGSFLELKYLHTTPMHNYTKFNGTSQINGGAPTPIIKSLKNESMDSVSTLLLVIGKHY